MEVAQDIDPACAQCPAHADIAAALTHPVHGEPDDAEDGDDEQHGAQYAQQYARGSGIEVGGIAGLGKSLTCDYTLAGELEQPLIHGVYGAADLSRAAAHDVHHPVVDVVVGEEG